MVGQPGVERMQLRWVGGCGDAVDGSQRGSCGLTTADCGWLWQALPSPGRQLEQGTLSRTH